MGSRGHRTRERVTQMTNWFCFCCMKGLPEVHQAFPQSRHLISPILTPHFILIFNMISLYKGEAEKHKGPDLSLYSGQFWRVSHVSIFHIPKSRVSKASIATNHNSTFLFINHACFTHILRDVASPSAPQ